MRLTSLTVTPLSPLSLGGCAHFHTHHVLCVCDGHTWGKRYVIANYRLKVRHFIKGKVRKKSSGCLYGWIPLNQPLSWLSWHWGAKCHANSSVSRKRKSRFHHQVLPFFFLLRIACCLKQMPRLINALPLAQQLSNKQDISVGLLSVFCVTESEREREKEGVVVVVVGAPKYSKPIKWDPVYTSCSFIWCFWNADFPLSFTSVHRLILKELMEESVNNLAASST